MIRKLLFIAFALGTPAILFAQNPGYLGKHFILSARGGVSMAILGPTAGNKGFTTTYGSDGGLLGFNTHWGLGASYVTSRSAMLDISIEQLRTGMIMNAYSQPSPVGFQNHSLFYRLRSNNIQFTYKKFPLGNGGLAPFGGYIGALAGLGLVSADLLRWDIVSPGETPPATLINERYNYIYAGFEIGGNQIFFDRFVLSASTRIAIPLGFMQILNYAFSDVNYQNDYVEYNNQEFKKGALSRMISCHLLNFHLGLGYLIF